MAKQKSKTIASVLTPSVFDPPENEDVPDDQIVAVDHGDLSELQQSAEAWAGYLRFRAKNVRKELGALPIAVEDAERYIAAADRIDQAISRSRRDALDSTKAQEKV